MSDQFENIAALRIDKWLWYCRFFKTRTLATMLCNSSKLRLNEEIVRKAQKSVHVGDVLTFPLGHDVRVIRVVALGSRRGPASEAQTLYEDLEPPQPHSRKERATSGVARREAGSGRPTKTERRATDRLRERD